MMIARKWLFNYIRMKLYLERNYTYSSIINDSHKSYPYGVSDPTNPIISETRTNE